MLNLSCEKRKKINFLLQFLINKNNYEVKRKRTF